jgi:Flp pilus assembly protein CpaB
VDLGTAQAVPARRGLAPGWRDPRLWIGLLIVSASVVAGALVVGSADHRVPVWTATEPLAAGHVLTAGDLVVRRVELDDASLAAYLSAARPVPAGQRLSRGVGAGELVPRSAVGTSGDDLLEVPVAVAPGQVPVGTGAGDTVDVYLRSGDDGCGSACGRPVLTGVSVLAAPSGSDGGTAFGGDGTRALVLGLTPDQARRYFARLADVAAPELTVVGRG